MRFLLENNELVTLCPCASVHFQSTVKKSICLPHKLNDFKHIDRTARGTIHWPFKNCFARVLFFKANYRSRFIIGIVGFHFSPNHLCVLTGLFYEQNCKTSCHQKCQRLLPREKTHDHQIQKTCTQVSRNILLWPKIEAQMGLFGVNSYDLQTGWSKIVKKLENSARTVQTSPTS